MNTLDEFLQQIHKSSGLISIGTASVMERTVPAAEVCSLYGQILVWGMFGVEKGKFKGKLANNAGTEDVIYTPTVPRLPITFSRTSHE